jgi:hypothetical protein
MRMTAVIAVINYKGNVLIGRKKTDFKKFLSQNLVYLGGSVIIEFDDGRYMSCTDEDGDLAVDASAVGNSNTGYDYYFKDNPTHKRVIEKAQEKFDMYLEQIQLSKLEQAGF